MQHFIYWVLDGIKSELSSIHSSPPASWFVGVLQAAVSSSVCCHDFPSRWTVPSNCEPFLHIAFFSGHFIAADLMEGTTSPLNGSAANGLLNNFIVADSLLHSASSIISSCSCGNHVSSDSSMVPTPVCLWLVPTKHQKLTWRLLWSNPSVHGKYVLLSWLIKGWLADS